MNELKERKELAQKTNRILLNYLKTLEMDEDVIKKIKEYLEQQIKKCKNEIQYYVYIKFCMDSSRRILDLSKENKLTYDDIYRILNEEMDSLKAREFLVF